MTSQSSDIDRFSSTEKTVTDGRIRKEKRRKLDVNAVVVVDHHDAISREPNYGDQMTMIEEEACTVLSVDVMEKIFARLPLKSMIHTRLLSKFWCNHVFSANFRHEVHSFWKKVPPTAEELRGLVYVENDHDAYELFDWLFVRHLPPGTILSRPQLAVMTAAWPLPLGDELRIVEVVDV